MKSPSNLRSNVEKWTFWCLVRPDPAKVREKNFVWSVRSSRTPLDLPNFNLKYRFSTFYRIFGFSSFSQVHRPMQGVGIGMGKWGEEENNKRHKKGSHFDKKWRFLMFSDISRNIFCFGVISGNINPLGGYRGQIPGFWKPRFRVFCLLGKLIWKIWFWNIEET